jgi:hypothetical protein
LRINKRIRRRHSTTKSISATVKDIMDKVGVNAPKKPSPKFRNIDSGVKI